MKSTFNVEFDADLRLDLECFRHAAYLGTPAANVVREAVKAFIQQRLGSDSAVKAKFLELRDQKLREASVNAGNKVSFLPKRKRK
jgi:hypothetical protein